MTMPPKRDKPSLDELLLDIQQALFQRLHGRYAPSRRAFPVETEDVNITIKMEGPVHVHMHDAKSIDLLHAKVDTLIRAHTPHDPPRPPADEPSDGPTTTE